MDNNDVKILVDSFKSYRDLLSPIQNNLSAFVDTYEQLQGDINKLNSAFSGDVKDNLASIYKNLSAQADKATDLSARIDHFIRVSNKYTADIARLTDTFAKAEKSLTAIVELEDRAEEQLGKLDNILQEKKKSYNIKELQKTLDNYNENVQKVSEFINKDVADALMQNSKQLDMLKESNEYLHSRIEKEHASIASLAETYETTNKLLKELVDRNAVNAEYVYDTLDSKSKSNMKKQSRNKRKDKEKPQG